MTVTIALLITVVLIMVAFFSFSSDGASNNLNDLVRLPASMIGEASILGNENKILPSKTIPIMVTLKYRNQEELCSLLAALQNPSSALYHKYLNRTEFADLFSATPSQYRTVVSYFESFGLSVETYPDRVSIYLNGTAREVENAFHTSIACLADAGRHYYAPSAAYLPANVSSLISGISGLNDSSSLYLSPLFVDSGTTQYVTGTDFQQAYDLRSIYNANGYPTNETIATILWSGNNSLGQPVAPFVPSDIYAYYSSVIPSGEPIPHVYGYPVLGALPPGPSAATDSTEANIESTLDLEMAGSTAPGANIVEVYGPAPTLTDVDAAFASILNPDYNSTVDSALNNVTVISNSWGCSTNTNNTAWMQDEEEAAARGITVLAASGDDGDKSSNIPSFPASMAYNNFGTVAVGGLQENLSGFQSYNGTGTTGISSASVWYNTPSAGDGSQGGVSSIFPEPVWQVNSSDANAIIHEFSPETGVSSGRATPDIAADGANMLMYVTLDTGFAPTSGFVEVWGTSIASPLTAGLIASIVHYEGSGEGFMDPIIYKLGQEEYKDQFRDFPPFYSVYNGSNALFPAEHGYSLSVGWGSINAYNFARIQEGIILPTPPMTTFVYSEVNGPSADYSSYFLPGAEEFTVGNTSENVTFVTLYLYGPGTVNVSIGTSLFGSQVAGPIELNLSDSSSWYNISLPNLRLSADTPYYLSVYGSSSAGWGNIYASNATVIKGALRDFYYGSGPPGGNPKGTPSNDTSTPDLYSIGFQGVVGHFDKYGVTIREKGLPAGVGWTVHLYNNVYYSTSSVINATLYNGSYLMNVMGYHGYHPVSSPGILTVRGANESVSVSFSKSLFLLYFNETGLPKGTEWYVTMNGTLKNSTSSSISFLLPYGSYNFSIGNVTKYFTAPDTGTIFLNKNQTIIVPFLSSSIERARFAYVNASSINTYLYTLPGSQEFSVGKNNVEADYIDLYLKGHGTINVSVGSSLLISNIVSNVSLNVNSNSGGWVNITIPPTSLSANISYYLNVWSVNGSSILWGYTTSPSESYNALFAFWFYGTTMFMTKNLPNLFTIGYSISSVYPA